VCDAPIYTAVQCKKCETGVNRETRGSRLVANCGTRPTPGRVAGPKTSTRAASDIALLKSWLRSLNSPHTQRDLEMTAKRLPAGASRAACAPLPSRTCAMCQHQHERRPGGGRTPVRASHQVTARLRPCPGLHALQCRHHHQAALGRQQPRWQPGQAHHVRRWEVGLLIRAAPSKRDRVLPEVTYAGGCASPKQWH
jgi:hypothetical protein